MLWLAAAVSDVNSCRGPQCAPPSQRLSVAAREQPLRAPQPVWPRLGHLNAGRMKLRLLS